MTGLPRVTGAQMADAISIYRRLWHGEAFGHEPPAGAYPYLFQDSGRDPASVRVWSVLATVEESVGEELRLRKLVGRLATYLQGYGEVLVAANGWSLEAPAAFRAHPLVCRTTPGRSTPSAPWRSSPASPRR